MSAYIEIALDTTAPAIDVGEPTGLDAGATLRITASSPDLDLASLTAVVTGFGGTYPMDYAAGEFSLALPVDFVGGLYQIQITSADDVGNTRLVLVPVTIRSAGRAGVVQASTFKVGVIAHRETEVVGVSGGSVHTRPPAPAVKLTYYQEVMRTPGLISYWRLAESGPTEFLARDERDVFDGTYFNGVQGVPSLLPSDSADKAWQITASDDNIHFNDTAYGFPGRAPFSVEFLYKPDGTPTPDTPLVARAFATGGWGICVGTDGALEVFRNNVGQSGPDPASTVQSGGAPLADGITRHIVYTYDGTNSTFYFDGVLQSPVAHPLSVFDNGELRIGRVPAFSGSGGLGIYDELSIYSTALNASRVALHYSATGLS